MRDRREILLVEDDLGFAQVLESWIRIKLPGSNIAITHARTIEQGFEAARKGVYAILLDLTLSAEWTSETTPTVIKDFRQFAPVIVVSGKSFDGEGSEVDWIADLIAVHGADDFVSKNDKDLMSQLCMRTMAAVGRRIFANKP